jgi:hypothetical protein
MEFAWIMHGLCLDYVGICMDYAWLVHRTCMDYAWNMHGLCMDYAWNIHGIYMNYAWKMHGLCMDYAWNMHGVMHGLYIYLHIKYVSHAHSIATPARDVGITSTATAHYRAISHIIGYDGRASNASTACVPQGPSQIHHGWMDERMGA